MTIFDIFEHLPKIVFTRMSEGHYFGVDFVNILCECDLPTYYPKFTLNNDKVKKNINIVLVTIFNKFQNLQDFILTRSKVIIMGYILKIFYAYVISQHITLNLH